MSDPSHRVPAKAATSAAPPAPRRHRRGWRSWEKAHHRAIMLVLEGLCALIAGMLVLVVLLAVRLDLAPLQLNFLTPPLVSWLDGRLAPLKVEVARTSIRWAPGLGSIDLDLDGLKLRDPRSGKDVVSVATASTAIAIRPLVEGEIRPLRLDIRDPRFDVVRVADGTWTLGGMRASDQPTGLGPEDILERVDALFSAAHGTDPDGQPLTTIQVTGIAANVDDRLAGRPWRIEDASIALTGRHQGFAADAGLSLSLTGAPDHGSQTRLDGHIDFVGAGQPVGVRLSTTPVDPASWAALLPRAGPALARIHMRLGGSIEGFVRPPMAGGDWRLGAISADLSLGAGTIEDPFFVGGVLGLASAGLKAHYDPARQHLAIDRLTADFHGPKAVLEASLDNVPDDPARFVARLIDPPPGGDDSFKLPFGFHVVSGQVTVAQVMALWPPSFHDKTRRWIAEHILKGVVDRVEFSQKLVLYPSSNHRPDHVATGGGMALEGVTLDYLNGLPPGQDIKSDAIFSLDNLTFLIRSGHAGGFTFRGGQIVLDKLGNPDVPSWLDLDVDLTGPVRNAITILGADRLKLKNALPFKPAQFDGGYDGSFHLRLPLVKDVPRDQVLFGAKGKLSDLTLRGAAPDIDISEGAFDLAVDNKALALQGPCKIDGAPANLRVAQPLDGPKPHVTKVVVHTVLDDAMRQRLKMAPVAGALKGPVGLDMDWRGPDRAHATADIAIDLTAAEVTVNLVNWHKPRGKPAHTKFTGEWRNGHLLALRNLAVEGPGLSVNGSVDFDVTGRFSHFSADRLVLNARTAHGVVRQDASGWHVQLAGQVIDLSPYLKNINGKTNPADRPDAPAVDLDLSADHLILGPGRQLDQARLKLSFAQLNLISGDIQARAGQGPLQISVAPPDQGGAVRVEAGDFGAFVKAVGISEHVSGGKAEITGTAPMAGDHRRYILHVVAHDYRMVDAPIMAKLLSLASLSSISSQLSGHGIPFDQLTGDVVDDDGMIQVSDLHAGGNAFGINAEGMIDLAAKRLSIKGTMVPAFLFNNALSHIPVIGEALVGGKGQGVFSINFSVGGTIDNPTALINPLSIFAPGAVRHIPIFGVPVLSRGAAKPAVPEAGN